MSIAKPIHRWTRVVPLRFERAPDANNANATSGAFHQDAPDPDDRGAREDRRGAPFSDGTGVLPVGLDEALPAANVPETRVRLVRKDMENAGDLYVTLSNASIADITLPANNAKLPNTANMLIKLRAKRAGEGFLEVRFGARTGPIIHRIKIVVTGIKDVAVFGHQPTINGAALNDSNGVPVPAQSTRSLASINTLMGVANAIYFPYGIRFSLRSVTNTGTLNFTNQGMVDDLSAEFNQLTAHNRQNRAINAYFVPQIANPTAPSAGARTPTNQVGGVATSAISNPNTFGLIVADWAGSGQVVAHEIGHLLNLVNDPVSPANQRFIHINTRQDPARPGTGRDVRDDHTSRRRLMWAYTNLLRVANQGYRDDVGYGMQNARNGQPGGMLTVKQLNADNTDLEMAEVRRTARRLRSR